MTRAALCRACGGVGTIDEQDAARLGIDLGEARVDWCPRCHGTGAQLHWPFSKLLAWVFVGSFVMGFLVFVAFAGAMSVLATW